MHRFSIIGPGRIGGALAVALSHAGAEIADIFYRSEPPSKELLGRISGAPNVVHFGDGILPKGDVILITTADQDIENAAAILAKNISGTPAVLHTSGSLSSDVLAKLRETGCNVGSMHPLISISDPIGGAECFRDAFFCIEGDAEAIKTADEAVKLIGGKPFTIDTKMKPLYHAAAVTACGHLTALVDAAIEMLGNAGFEPADAKAMLLPLIKSTVANIEEKGTAKALTGSFARGDLSAVERHVAAIEQLPDASILPIYMLLGERSLRLAVEAGLSSDVAEAIEKYIYLVKTRLK
jgi:predicted short-subunit dehydrogenase-like oxidoreductase (DUF2520 family)